MKTIEKNIIESLLHLFSKIEQFIFLDTSKPQSENNRSMLFLNPVERLQYHDGGDVRSFLEEIQVYQGRGFYVAGWIGYEFGCLLENSLEHQLCREEDRGALLADFGVFASPHIFDHSTGEHDFPFTEKQCIPNGYKLESLHPSQDREEYLKAINKILEYIRAGDTYQVNYTLKLLFDFIGSPELFYRDLRRNQSVSYGAYIRWGDERILSFSPELFFRKNGQKIMVRPMKGTLKRGRTLPEDKENCQFLSNDIKNRSENVMIVDLLRNDLGRLMHYLADGDVRVDSLFDVETYETLLQMTSTITGVSGSKPLDEVSLFNFFKAMFPCGSVTGAPKIRTMQIINELETQRRGVYTGAIGYLSPAGEAVFNVPIRTIVLDGTKGEMGIGSGIVSDSDPENEWEECLLKGRFLTHPEEEFHLIETLLWHPQNGYWLLEEHLERLKCSAEYFLFYCDIREIKSTLFTYCKEYTKKCQRVRLLLSKDGTFELSHSMCDEPLAYTLPQNSMETCDSLPRVRFSKTTVDKDSVWYYHKTSRRELYGRMYQEAVKENLFDICFFNYQGEVTEGCISSIIIQENGSYVTPPLNSGLLAGVMRQHLLKDKKKPLLERVITKKDMLEAEAIFLCNSVRGVVQVSLEDGGM